MPIAWDSDAFARGEGWCLLFSGRRSGRPEKKNIACNIMKAKRAEYRLLEILGKLQEVSKVEGTEQKMNAYLDMYKKTAFSTSDRSVEHFGGQSQEVEARPSMLFLTGLC
jgi:hypothetical protein